MAYAPSLSSGNHLRFLVSRQLMAQSSLLISIQLCNPVVNIFGRNIPRLTLETVLEQAQAWKVQATIKICRRCQVFASSLQPMPPLPGPRRGLNASWIFGMLAGACLRHSVA